VLRLSLWGRNRAWAVSNERGSAVSEPDLYELSDRVEGLRDKVRALRGFL